MDIEVPLSPIADYILMPGRVHFIGGTDDSISTSAHLLSRSFNRFFFTCSLGLLAPPSSHESTLPTLTMCSSPALLRESSIVLLAQKSFPQKRPAEMRPWLRSRPRRDSRREREWSARCLRCR